MVYQAIDYFHDDSFWKRVDVIFYMYFEYSMIKIFFVCLNTDNLPTNTNNTNNMLKQIASL